MIDGHTRPAESVTAIKMIRHSLRVAARFWKDRRLSPARLLGNDRAWVVTAHSGAGRGNSHRRIDGPRESVHEPEPTNYERTLPGILERLNVIGLQLKQRSLRDQNLRIGAGHFLVIGLIQTVRLLRAWKHFNLVLLDDQACGVVIPEHT